MAKPRKLSFTLETPTTTKTGVKLLPLQGANIKIVGQAPRDKVYVVIETPDGGQYFIQDKDLELFRLNLFKAFH